MLSHFKSDRSSRIGVIALDNGWINQAQLSEALKHQADLDCRLGESLVDLGYLSEFQLKKALCRQRWMRSFVASVMMLSTPVCPVLASEKDEEIDFSATFSSHVSDYEAPRIIDSAPFGEVAFTQDSDFVYAINHQFSPRTGIELGISEQPLSNTETGFVPKISVYTSLKSNVKQQGYKSGTRSDRYKDTIPAVYRLTLKGYSVYENNSYHSKYWAFDKVKDSPYRKYEIMFSVTKEF